MIGIYVIKNTLNNKTYIGKSLDLRNIGKPRSIDTKEKIRKAITGIKRSEATKLKTSESKKGKKHD